MAATFTFVFVAIGQGDCCLVKCPDGRVLVVDCGRTANKWGNLDWVTNAQLQLRAWTKDRGNKVDVLVLTHPDADHHNQVINFFSEAELLTEFTTSDGTKIPKGHKMSHVGIDTILISNAGLFSCLGQYNCAALHTNVYGNYFGTGAVYEVTINSSKDTENKYRRWDKKDGFKDVVEETQINGKRFLIMEGTTDSTAWTVEIIAGNVPKGYDGVNDAATEDNAKSLVTLFTVGSKKALLCGDATFSTERFLVKVQKSLIENASLAQVPHHGSAYASSSGFVNKVNATAAVVSVGFLEHSYRLPRYPDVLERWLDVVENRGSKLPDHDIDYWYAAKNDQAVVDKYNEWTANNTDLSKVGHNDSGTFWYLLAPAGGDYALYRQLDGGMFLFRETVDSNLRVTSQRTQAYTLTDAGVTAL